MLFSLDKWDNYLSSCNSGALWVFEICDFGLFLKFRQGTPVYGKPSPFNLHNFSDIHSSGYLYGIFKYFTQFFYWYKEKNSVLTFRAQIKPFNVCWVRHYLFERRKTVSDYISSLIYLVDCIICYELWTFSHYTFLNIKKLHQIGQ